ncbi:MAG: hypothetical protein IJK06_11010 [Clostridia bacterium]|nr:hypothetical protein [Clostridia bacterium]
MTAESYFSQYRCLQSWLESDRQTLKALRASIGDVHAPEIHTDRVQVSPCGSAPYIRTLEILEHLEHKVDLEQQLLDKLKAQMVTLASSLDPQEQQLLILRYIACQKWEAIIDSLFASRATVFRWHKEIMARITLPEDAIDIRKELSQPDALDCA